MSRILQIIIIILILITISSCKEKTKTVPKDVFKPNLIALFVEDIDSSLNWYKEKLNFEVERSIEEYPDYGLKIAFLESNDFHLEIIEKANSFKQSEITINQDRYVGGVFKIGFKTNDLEKVYNQLKKFNDVEFVTDIGILPENKIPIPWPTKFFLIKDPDGNFIQFFDLGNSKQISLWLTMITVDSLENSIFWYSEFLGFKHHKTMGEKGNRRAVLERNNYVLELFEPNEVIKASQISVDTTVLGFRKIAFEIKDLTYLAKDKIEIVSPIEKSDFEWASKAMIVKDLEGNWTQIFEKK